MYDLLKRDFQWGTMLINAKVIEYKDIYEKECNLSKRGQR